MAILESCLASYVKALKYAASVSSETLEVMTSCCSSRRAGIFDVSKTVTPVQKPLGFAGTMAFRVKEVMTPKFEKPAPRSARFSSGWCFSSTVVMVPSGKTTS